MFSKAPRTDRPGPVLCRSFEGLAGDFSCRYLLAMLDTSALVMICLIFGVMENCLLWACRFFSDSAFQYFEGALFFPGESGQFRGCAEGRPSVDSEGVFETEQSAWLLLEGMFLSVPVEVVTLLLPMWYEPLM